MARKLAGVRFQRAGRVYYCDPGDMDLQVNDQVVVQTDQSSNLGWVVIAPRQFVFAEATEPHQPILRVATQEDLAQSEEPRTGVREAPAESIGEDTEHD